jgi:hypothetical protein
MSLTISDAALVPAPAPVTLLTGTRAPGFSLETARCDIGLPMTAARYWLLRVGDEELRFSQRASAEGWASRIAAQGTCSHLTWHDGHTPCGAGAGRHVA